MDNPEALLRAAREKRELAARVRRLAAGLSLDADHQRMMQHALELEDEAAKLERQAEGNPGATPAAPHGMPMQQGVQQQQQVQQHEAEPKPAEPKPADKKKPGEGQ